MHPPHTTSIPTSADLARGRDFLSPQRKAPSARIRRWQPFRNPAGSMRGFVSVELPSGLIVNDVKLMIGPGGKYWIATPAIKRTTEGGEPKFDARGKPVWSPIVEFASREARDKFTGLV